MVLIRQAVADDAPAVARAHIRAWQVAYRGLLPQDYLDALTPEDRAKRYTFEAQLPSGPFTQVAIDEDTICGHVTTGRFRMDCADVGGGDGDGDDLPGDGEIRAIYVDPSRWGTGVGRHLMIAGCAHLRAQGHRTAFLWVLSGNVRARRFYERAGWHWDGAERTDVIGESSVEEVRYRRSLEAVDVERLRYRRPRSR